MFDTDLVSVGLVHGVLSVTQPDEIAMYLRDFNDLASIAVYGHAARELIGRPCMPSGDGHGGKPGQPF